MRRPGPGPLVVAIDGPAGSGKSTVARALAERLRLPHVDTGAMYRALTLKALRKGVPVDDEGALRRLAEGSAIGVDDGRILLDGEDVSAEIRSPPVTAAVSQVAAHRAVREWMVACQQRVVSARGGVVEGRDIGTVVVPDAHVKVFLTAAPQERARRRTRELREDGVPVEEGEVLQEIEARDRMDSGRAASPLAVAAGARLIDSTGRSVEDVVSEIERICREAG